MMKTRIWMLAILAIFFVVVSCEKEGDDPINEAQVLAEYLESAEVGDYANTAMPAIIKAGGTDGVKAMNELGSIYIIDIRAAEDFANGHIENAVNVGAKDVNSHLAGINMDDYEKVAIVCYSGQSAAWATCIARLAGYDKVYSMKWGMSSWHEDFSGPWNNNTSNMYANEFTTDATEKGPAGDLPVLSTGGTTGAEILEARLTHVIGEGFGATAVSAAEVFGALDNYYIVNYWSAEHYANPGHIPGAMQYTPKASISLDADLKTLPTDKTVVIYCYTGQTSANMAVYLRTLGYDAKTLKFGVNSMIYDDVPKAKWNAEEVMNYAYVTP